MYFKIYQHCRWHLSMVINWTPTTGITLYQVHPGPPHEPQPPSVGKRHSKAQGPSHWRVGYFSLSSGVLNRTSFHMCGGCYLSTFLLRDRLLTIINIASLILLVRFCATLPIVYASVMTFDNRMDINWRKGLKVFSKSLFKCSKSLFKCSCRFNNIFFNTLSHVMLVAIYHSTSLCNCVFFIEATNSFLMVFSFEVYLYSILGSNVLETITEPLV